MNSKQKITVAAMALVIAAVTRAQEATNSVAAEISARLATEEAPTLVDLLNRGGALMYPLYLCSIVVVAFAIERAIRLRRAVILPSDIVEKIRNIPSHGTRLNPQALLAELKNHPSPIARVIIAGLRRVDRPLPELERAIEDAGQREADHMRRGCRVLSIIASISPLLGLLGTVLGMITAFMTVASREDALGRTELLAGGIYQALVTTATGLSIAIPALVLYYLFTEKVDRLVSEMDDICIDLVENLKADGELA